VSVSNAYIRFLNLIDALDHMNPGRSLDSLEIQLLEFIVQQQAQNQAVLVGDIISLNYIGSQATLHSRLKDLVLHGYVKLIADKKDARKKSVIPTRLAAKYIEFMSNCLEKSVKLT
jgi:DNA-binding MarR family transcriptional regulator